MGILTNKQTIEDGRYKSFLPEQASSNNKQRELEKHVKSIMDDKEISSNQKYKYIFNSFKAANITRNQFNAFEEDYSKATTKKRVAELVTVFVAKLVIHSVAVAAIISGTAADAVGNVLQAAGNMSKWIPTKTLGEAISAVGVGLAKTGTTVGSQAAGDFSSPTKHFVKKVKNRAI